MHPDIDKWNARYRNADSGTEPQACRLLQEFAFLLPKRGTALDLACGRGGNALLLAKAGLTTCAWDISDVALSQLATVAQHHNLAITTELRNVESQPPGANSFDCIVVSYFLDRHLCRAISNALKPGGILFYQTFSVNKRSDKGPSNERFLLKNNELLTLFGDLEVRFYHELAALGNLAKGDRDTVQLIAQKNAIPSS